MSIVLAVVAGFSIVPERCQCSLTPAPMLGSVCEPMVLFPAVVAFMREPVAMLDGLFAFNITAFRIVTLADVDIPHVIVALTIESLNEPSQSKEYDSAPVDGSAHDRPVMRG
jgi:hypothetical protein